MSTLHSHTALPVDLLGNLCARAARRILEGPHEWGRYEASTSRTGATHFRLVVYPPGTSSPERRALMRARDWPLFGALGALLWLAAVGDLLHPLLATAIALAVYTAGVITTRSHTRELRRRVRTVDAVRVFDGVRMTTRGDLRLLQQAASQLHRLDEDAAAGRLDRVAYESRWSEIYAAVTPAA